MTLPFIYLAFLITTFALHYGFVMIIIGTPILVIGQSLTGHRDDRGARQFLKMYYPVCISLTITTGVAPLLFSQTLYHRNFYQTFINLYPFPLVVLILMVIFFYNSYIIQHLSRDITALTALQIVLALGFVLFFSTLSQGIAHPQSHASDYWDGRRPAVSGTRLMLHVVAGIIGSGIFLRLYKRRFRLSVLILYALGLGMALFREWQRMTVLGGRFPTPVATDLDSSFGIFLFFFVVMIAVLVYSFHIAGINFRSWRGRSNDAPSRDATPAAPSTSA